MSRNRKRRKLYKANPHCHYCGVKTLLVGIINGRQRDTDATIEHLYSRLDPRRKQDDSIVLACYRCNQRKSAESIRRYPEIHKLKSICGQLLSEFERKLKKIYTHKKKKRKMTAGQI